MTTFPSNIPVEAVEAALAAMLEHVDAGECCARTALEAAAPHMLQEAKAEAWSHGHHDGAVDQMLHMENGGAKTTPNPYILNNEGEK